jgi:hypothetical protein
MQSTLLAGTRGRVRPCSWQPSSGGAVACPPGAARQRLRPVPAAKPGNDPGWADLVIDFVNRATASPRPGGSIASECPQARGGVHVVRARRRMALDAHPSSRPQAERRAPCPPSLCTTCWPCWWPCGCWAPMAAARWQRPWSWTTTQPSGGRRCPTPCGAPAPSSWPATASWPTCLGAWCRGRRAARDWHSPTRCPQRVRHPPRATQAPGGAGRPPHVVQPSAAPP